MGKVLKSHWTSSAAFVAAAAVVCGPVWAGAGGGMNNSVAGSAGPANAALQKAQAPQCSASNYQLPAQQSNLSSCQSQCKSAVDEWKKKIDQVVKKNSAADAGVSTSTTLSSQKAANNYSGQQKNGQTDTSGVTGGAGDSMNQRGSLARETQEAFKQCEAQLRDKCKSVLGSDARAVDEAIDACNQGAKDTGKFADTQKQGAGGMGDLSKMMDMAGKAMQAMQAMQQQPEASDVSQPPAAPAEQSYETQVSSMGGKSGSNAPVGFGSADGKSVENELAAVEGGGSGVSGSSTSFRPDDSSSSDMGGPVAASTMGVSGGGGSGAGAGNSSGSSRPAEAMEAAASYNNGGAFEMNMGGGTRMMGLKPSRTDLEAMGGEVTPSEAGVVAEGEGDGRGLASEETAGANEGPTQDGDSVFARVRFKYSVLKGAGRI